MPWYVMIAEGRYKYVRNFIEGEVEELYDLERDPEELKNLALQLRHTKRLKAYRQKAIEELRRTQAPFVANMPRPSTLK